MTTPLPQPPPAETRLTTLLGDRLCITCGFNLHGQPVVREPVYGMVMVRCPECSTPAALQEYPLLGKWPSRLAAVLAAGWLLLLIAGIFASAGITFGTAEGAIQMGSTKLATDISQKFSDWYEKADEKSKASFAKQWGGGAATVTVGPYSYIDATWWESFDKSTLLADAGGLRFAVSKAAVSPLIWSFVSGVLLGILWSIFLLGLRRPRLLILGLLVVGLAFGFELLWGTLVDEGPGRWNSSLLWASTAAAQVLAPYVLAISLLISLIGLFVGLWTGRPLTRWFVRLLLPPRLASALSILWIAEGKSLPRPHRKPAPKPS